MNVERIAPQLTTAEFERISSALYNLCGISLGRSKTELVRSRLSKRLAALGLPDFSAYLQFIEQDRTGAEVAQFVDVLTTNKTSFFREPPHFDFLRDRVIPALPSHGIRIWSAACSTGEEPYSIAIMLREVIPQIESWDIKILATDISTRVLKHARAGHYGSASLSDVAPGLLTKYFEPVGTTADIFAVRKPIRKMVGFARLNLMETWPMKGQFDVILCRNVMIYFSKATQLSLVRRMSEHLAPGGYLLIGHAESLTGMDHGLRYVKPAIYQK